MGRSLSQTGTLPPPVSGSRVSPGCPVLLPTHSQGSCLSSGLVAGSLYAEKTCQGQFSEFSCREDKAPHLAVAWSQFHVKDVFHSTVSGGALEEDQM